MNNDEIKEILDYLQESSKKDEATKQLVDYITNLQQENQELNKENEKWWAIIKDNEQEIKDLCLENSKLEQENQRLKELDENYPIEEELAEAYRREEDYKSRCEKAVEWLITKADRRSLHELIDILNGKE